MMNKKEQYIFDKVQEAILVEYSIQCQKCKSTKIEYNTDEYYFVEKLIEIGWTYKRDIILCKECS